MPAPVTAPTSCQGQSSRLFRLQGWALLSHDQKGAALDKSGVLEICLSVVRVQGIMIQQGSTAESSLWARHSLKAMPHVLEAPTYILKLQD